MSAETDLLRQVEALHAKLDKLSVGPVRHGWLKHILHDFEYNPKTQYKVHIIASYWWIFNLPFIVGLYLFLPELWIQIGVFITLLYSLYANFATDYGAASSALAAMHETPLPTIPLEPDPKVR